MINCYQDHCHKHVWLLPYVIYSNTNTSAEDQRQTNSALGNNEGPCPHPLQWNISVSSVAKGGDRH